MIRAFRKYHRQLALIMFLPLLLTVVTGVIFTIVDEWLGQKDLARFILAIHSGKIFRLETIYPILNGLGLAGMLVTGITMTPIFRRRVEQHKASDS